MTRFTAPNGKTYAGKRAYAIALKREQRALERLQNGINTRAQNYGMKGTGQAVDTSATMHKATRKERGLQTHKRFARL